MANRTIICASPRAMGKSARVAKGLATALSRHFPADKVETLRLADLDIHHCIGCNACEATGECFMEDDMATVLDALASTDALYIVSPVYFAGPPANYKAMIDRFQPHYWLETRKKPKHQACLVVLGDGGDPNGYAPLVDCTRSGLAVAGFQLAQVYAYIGLDSDRIVDNVERDLFGEGSR
ncbi:MAG: flavodoxin family protein [Eggerthellaceae bacterium]|nr:flavodoxin family protein [Eggerthellaceae bacterium]